MVDMEIKISWKDKDGEEHSKTYTDTKMVAKARAWLVNQGCTDIDIAVVM